MGGARTSRKAAVDLPRPQLKCAPAFQLRDLLWSPLAAVTSGTACFRPLSHEWLPLQKRIRDGAAS